MDLLNKIFGINLILNTLPLELKGIRQKNFKMISSTG